MVSATTTKSCVPEPVGSNDVSESLLLAYLESISARFIVFQELIYSVLVSSGAAPDDQIK